MHPRLRESSPLATKPGACLSRHLSMERRRDVGCGRLDSRPQNGRHEIAIPVPPNHHHPDGNEALLWLHGLQPVQKQD